MQFAGDAEALRLASLKDVEIEDLGGATVLPGFSDAHIHLLEYGLSLQRADCETATRAECLARVRAQAGKMNQGEWVLGHGWNHNVWPEGLGHKSDLDAAAGAQPVYLTHKSLHCGWANSAALDIAKINQHTPDPQSGRIARDKAGAPTGIIFESAMRLIEEAIPPINAGKRLSALLLAQRTLLSMGITTVHDFDTWDCYEALRGMEQNGQLLLRVVKSIPYPNLEQAIAAGLKSGVGSASLRIGWLKLFADGALGPQTAAMIDPYEGSPDRGMLFLTAPRITEIGRAAMGAGISLAIHAIGDRANREVINGFSHLHAAGFFEKCVVQPRMEHVQLIQPEDLREMASLGVTASMQPSHAVSDRDMADRYWGARCKNAYAWRRVRGAGARLIFGSDAPVESPNPFWGLYAALARKSPQRTDTRSAWIPEQRLTLGEALSAYISAPPSAVGWGNTCGNLAAGYCADLMVLKEDIFAMDKEILPEIRPLRVMSNGRWVTSQE